MNCYQNLPAVQLEHAGRQSDGIDVEARPEAGTLARPRLVLDASLDLGYLEVVNDDSADLDDGHHGFDDQTEDMRAAMEAACARDEPRDAAKEAG